MQYFINHHRADPDVAALTVDDFPVSRLQVVEPAPIPEDELQRTHDWMLSWDMLDAESQATNLVDDHRQESRPPLGQPLATRTIYRASATATNAAMTEA